jgi:DNA polymerase-4
MERAIVHVDMDAFFASVEQLDDPSLRGRPVLVGGASRRGVVAAASYEARTFGARSAMPMAEALRRCPDAIVVPPRRERYGEVSGQVFAIFRRFTPLVEGLSVDEAFLDVSASRSLFGDGVAIARRIKAAIREETGLTASAGVAPCKFAAKIASDLEKPDGLTVVPAEVAAFLAPLPLERMWGVGPKAAARLRAAGLATIGDLARAEPRRLERLMGESWGPHVQALARGLDDRPVDPDREAVSIGSEETYEHDLVTRRAIEIGLLDHAARVAQRLVHEGLAGDVVVVKLKYADFTLKTRRTTLPAPVADTDAIYGAARALLDRFELAPAVGPGRRAREGAVRPVRLVGVTVAGLVAKPDEGTLPLFAEDRSRGRGRRLEEVVSKIHDRFGATGLTRAALLERDEPRR